jgi:hypothetical protein
MCLAVIASFSVNQPVFGRELVPIVREVCKIFPSTHLKECGGTAADSSIGATWNSGSTELGIAAFNSTVASNLEVLQFTQNQFVLRLTEAGATIEEPLIVVDGCRQVRLAIASADGFVEAHGTGICHGFAVNFYVQGTLFTDFIVTRFKEAMAGLARDKQNHP